MKKICFPVTVNQGLESPVYEHFGSAPEFIVVDIESGSIETIINQDLNHQHGHCNPMKALGQNNVDAVVVGGIGGGALKGLQMKGAKVFMAHSGTVNDNLTLLKEGKLTEYTSHQVCGSHGAMNLGGHRHGHGHACPGHK